MSVIAMLQQLGFLAAGIDGMSRATLDSLGTDGGVSGLPGYPADPAFIVFVKDLNVCIACL